MKDEECRHRRVMVFMFSSMHETALIGLTVLGWIAALVWSCTAVQKTAT